MPVWEWLHFTGFTFWAVEVEMLCCKLHPPGKPPLHPLPTQLPQLLGNHGPLDAREPGQIFETAARLWRVPVHA